MEICRGWCHPVQDLFASKENDVRRDGNCCVTCAWLALACLLTETNQPAQRLRAARLLLNHFSIGRSQAINRAADSRLTIDARGKYSAEIPPAAPAVRLIQAARPASGEDKQGKQSPAGPGTPSLTHGQPREPRCSFAGRPKPASSGAVTQ
ncbi:hypothetical protein NDU88_010578 [Pleurodeles waltl]|uniref:Uncharacterized protein n=1 Tax=Pleurodeles waltl TaxID=8319 RepID=A0AAV7RYL5_PLEWA|nr:hypothetical protein NDU88_010578 [Pleurodeles waltl]